MMVTIEIIGHIDEHGQLAFEQPTNLPPGDVRIIIETIDAQAEATDETLWDEQFLSSQDVLDLLASEARQEYAAGLTDDFDSAPDPDDRLSIHSKRTRRFCELLRALPADIKQQAYAAYCLFKQKPHHPSLHFKHILARHPFYSVRMGAGYRAIWLRREIDLIIWVWIGSHAEYDKILLGL
ncbi:MAG: hypothetical protein ABI947_29805 [Chloroflexota bacterium]